MIAFLAFAALCSPLVSAQTRELKATNVISQTSISWNRSVTGGDPLAKLQFNDSRLANTAGGLNPSQVRARAADSCTTCCSQLTLHLCQEILSTCKVWSPSPHQNIANMACNSQLAHAGLVCADSIVPYLHCIRVLQIWHPPMLVLTALRHCPEGGQSFAWPCQMPCLHQLSAVVLMIIAFV